MERQPPYKFLFPTQAGEATSGAAAAEEEDVHRRVQLLEAENAKVKEERDEALTRVQELEAKLEQATAG